MTPQNQFLVSFACVIAGHIVLYKWGDRIHRFAGAMLLTAAWAFSSGAGIQQFSELNRVMHTRMEAAEPGKRMAEITDPPQWGMRTSTGVLSFTGAEMKDIPQWPAKPSGSW